MADVVDPATRSRMMAGIKGRNTKPELVIRTGLHAMGFRYRLHGRKLPGRPDLVFPGRRAVIFIHGCFWHHHDCHLFKWPSSRPEFWREKINGNVARDTRTIEALHEAGWRVLTIWECALKGRERLGLPEVLENAARWLQSGGPDSEIRGEPSAAR